MVAYVAEVWGTDDSSYQMLGMADTHRLAQRMIDDFLDAATEDSPYRGGEWLITEVDGDPDHPVDMDGKPYAT